jgi:hypothetical protein
VWLGYVEAATAMVREQAARRLDTRGRALALDRRRLWRDSGLVAREEKTERAAASPPKVVRWHASRAQNKRKLFDNVRKCGDGEGAKVTLVCRGGCGKDLVIDTGCNSAWFCPQCRARTATRFRLDFENKRLGLVTACTRASLTRRNQRKGLRWGERLVTLTLPHEGSPTERIRVLLEVWARFWRVLQDDLKPRLRAPSGITLDDMPNGVGTRIKGEELELADLLSYVRVLEWTPGSDGLGHPHLHVWLFSRFIEQSTIKALWEDAHEHVTGKRATLIVDVRKAGGDVAHELVKYLTKDWDVTPDGAKRARPEVFAEVYAALCDKRLRQSSAGFGMWAVAKFKACPCCGFERERGHWARVDLSHSLETHQSALGVPEGEPHPEAERVPLTAADCDLRKAYDETRDREWAAGFELRILRHRLRTLLS